MNPLHRPTNTLAVLMIIGMSCLPVGTAQGAPLYLYDVSSGSFIATTPSTLTNGPLAGGSTAANFLGYGNNGASHLGFYNSSGTLVEYDLLTGNHTATRPGTLTGGPLAGQSSTAPAGGSFVGYANNGVKYFEMYDVGGTNQLYLNEGFFQTHATTLSGGPLNGQSATANFLGYANDSATNLGGYNNGGTIESYDSFSGNYIGPLSTTLTGGPLNGLSAGAPAGFDVLGYGKQGGGSVVPYAAAGAPPVTQSVTTDFESATSVGTDGRDAGFANQGTSEFDTVDDWTWYTEASTTNDNLTIPFGAGTKTIGEQEIRVGGGLELQGNSFFFGWGGGNHANVLRSQTFTDVGAGTANVDWTANNSALKAYYSQDGGASWTGLSDGVDFTAVAGSLEVVFVGNDGNDSNTALDTVTISYQQSSPIPEPATMCALGLAITGLGGYLKRRKRA